MNHIQKGFTFVEVLVVISIIGLLASLGITGFQAVTRNGRDTLRKSDLEAIRSALELYKAENNSYPADDGSCDPTGLTPNYIAAVPADPQKTYNYCYIRDSALIYRLCAHLENGTTTDNCGGTDACGGDCNYQITNP